MWAEVPPEYQETVEESQALPANRKSYSSSDWFGYKKKNCIAQHCHSGVGPAWALPATPSLPCQ